MSAHIDAEPPPHEHEPAHAVHDETVVHHGSFNDYLVGFALAAGLTAIPFWIVMGDVFRDPKTAAVVIMIFAFVQIVVHVVYFLHMNSKSEGGWTLLALLFTGVLVFITFTGSLWIMNHLDSNMMPMSASEMRNMP